MAGDKWYIRSRGRVAGPHSLAQLQSLRKRRQLNRSHEISTDGENWRPAGELEDLFPSKPQKTQAQSQPEPDLELESPSSDQQWHYAKGTQRFGPISSSELQRLVATGMLTADDLIWEEGTPSWVPAQEVPTLSFPGLAPQSKSGSGFPVTAEIRKPVEQDYRGSSSATSSPAENASFFQWYKEPWKKYAQFDGRARRKEFWIFNIVNAALIFFMGGFAVFGSVLCALQEVGGAQIIGLLLLFGFGFLYVVISLAIFIPSLTVFVRRLHDTGRSGWWYWIGLIPLFGGISLFIFLVEKSEIEQNRFGPNPHR